MNRITIPKGSMFIANIIGLGFYTIIDHGINQVGNYYAIVECKKLFGQGFKWRGHQTCCHPIADFDSWNNLKIVKHKTIK